MLRFSPTYLHIPFLVILALNGLARADRFFVASTGVDGANRDGRSPKTAWKSLAYACDKVPQGKHSIHLAPGDYVATRTARPKSGTTIVGRKPYGKDRTRIIASKDWKLSNSPREAREGEYLIAFTKMKDVKIKSLALVSDSSHRITGAIRCFRSENVNLRELVIEEFRWAGIHAEICTKLTVTQCKLTNASVERDRYWSGLIRSRYLSDSEISHNRITSTIGGGYGYKGGGHTGARFHHNYVDVKGGFSFESAHENEYGMEIDHNYLTGCLSIPKGGQSADPSKRGYKHTFRIHHNYLTDSYTIEGPRNHLEVDHNWIHVEKTNGRIYTHHGGINRGPIQIHHNVIENVDRALIWMNRGLAEKIYVYNNTIFCADAGKRTGALLSAYSAERLNDWVFKNNVVVAAWSQSRKLMQDKRDVLKKIIATNNVLINVTGAPKGNYVNQDPGLKRQDAKPWVFYSPMNAESFVVDRGVKVGLPFVGKAPDLGAVELGEKQEWGKIPSPQR